MANKIVLTPTTGVGLQQALADSPIVLTIVPLMRGEKGEPGSGGGGSSSTITAIAGVYLSAHKAVAKNSNFAFYADCLSPAYAVGITLNATTPGNPATIQTSGEISDPSFDFTHEAVWLGENGELLNTPSIGAFFSVQLGIVTSRTSFLIRISEPVSLLN